jgi:hypothetical protein
MRRLAAAFVIIPLLAASTAAGAVPVLRDSVIVDEDLIRLGDLFDGIGEKADVAVAPAPRLGRRGIYDAAWLLSVARTHDLSWKPQSRFDRIIVERASLTIGAREIETALKAALAGAFRQSQPGASRRSGATSGDPGHGPPDRRRHRPVHGQRRHPIRRAGAARSQGVGPDLQGRGGPGAPAQRGPR